MPERIEISTKAILLIFAFVTGLWLFITIHDILLLLFMAFVVMSALKTNVDYMVRRGINRTLAIACNYVIILCILAIFATIVLPPLVSESIRLAVHLPELINKFAPFININQDTILQQITPIGQNIAKLTIGVFSNIFTILTIMVFSFYFLHEHGNVRRFLSGFIGSVWADQTVEIVKKIEERMGAWVRGELILGFIIGISSYIGLLLLGVNFALPLALLAGVLELVPIIGPIISAIPAIIVAFPDSPLLALKVVILYTVIQQLENNFIVPTVMQKSVGLPSLALPLFRRCGRRLWR